MGIKTDAHDTHCCIEHGCKYGDDVHGDGCAIVSGIRKQKYLCEMCSFYSEGYTDEEQWEHINALFESKNTPVLLNSTEEQIAKLAEKYGRLNLKNILKDIAQSGYTIGTIIATLDNLKHIK